MTHSSPVYLRVQPESIVSFDYIPRKYLTSLLRLSNPTTHFIAYKVRTTVPTSYLVKPHLGYLPPNSSVEITITMQPTNYDAQAAAAISDKFLVSAFPLHSETNSAILNDPIKFNKLWTEVPKSVLQNNKLSVQLNLEHKRLSPTSPLKSGFSYTSLDFESPTPKTSLPKTNDSLQSSSGSGFDGDSSKTPTGFQTPKWFNTSLSRETLSSESSREGQSSNSPTKKPKSPKEEAMDGGELLMLERIKSLEQKVKEFTEENKRQEKMNQAVEEINKQQDKLQKEVNTEKEQLANELKSLKGKVFKGENVNSTSLETFFSANKRFELWHIIITILFSFLIGTILTP